ncbi:MAG TPA: type II toxin-antitoxin system VapB family antitoxin [Planctomycetota bacterium]|nr:type II toxin-antitoxin system VapB family antitoxin [Planctomycetota bacterium]HRR81199.1 type II toxin-antitoxin system VapB family antitoxin [Planctomycetota bacterium]HRT95217.1 type II toxin-antitoxin system VapB family antitoxin [Planctomycetota bacterium]
MKRTNVVLDDELVGTAKSLTGIRTTRQVVDHALRELVRHRRQRGLLKLKGRIHWEGNLDEMRRGRVQP